tara:strand:- start:97 stop:336 length:240 start_codon:yes stop_codon:yes gene_type:complete
MIIASILMMFLFAVWSLFEYSDTKKAAQLLIAIGSGTASVGLALYLKHFLKKTALMNPAANPNTSHQDAESDNGSAPNA